MKKITFFIYVLLAFTIVISCSSDDSEQDNDDIPSLSNNTALLSIELLADSITYPAIISATDVVLNTKLPYGTIKASVKSIEISPGATANIKAGDILQLSESQHTITITAEDGITKKNTL